MTRSSKQVNSYSKGSGQVFIVEKVINKKVENGKIYYLLKWKHYPDSANTWEPVENLNCHDLVLEYEQAQHHMPGSIFGNSNL